MTNTNTKQLKRGDSIIYITAFLLRPLDDIEQLDSGTVDLLANAAAMNAQGVELGFIEREGVGGAWCRFFRIHQGQWLLRNTANAEFAVNANIRRFNHVATELIEAALVWVDAANKRMAELDGMSNSGNVP